MIRTSIKLVVVGKKKTEGILQKKSMRFYQGLGGMEVIAMLNPWFHIFLGPSYTFM